MSTPSRGFTATYAAMTGRSLEGVAYWEVLAGAIALEHSQRHRQIFEALGVTVSTTELRGRAAAFLDDALDRLT